MVIGGGVVGAASLLVYWGGLWLLANIRGIDVPSSVIGDVATHAARALLLAVGAALLAYALTMLFRNTVATLGVLFGINLLAPLLLSTSGLTNAERWMPHVNFTAVLQGGTTYYNPDLSDCAGDICQESLSAAAGLHLLRGRAGRRRGRLGVVVPPPRRALTRPRRGVGRAGVPAYSWAT